MAKCRDTSTDITSKQPSGYENPMGLWKDAIGLANWTFGALSDSIFGSQPKIDNGEKQAKEPNKSAADQGQSPLTNSAARYRTPSTPGTRRYLKDHFRKSQG